MLSKFFKHFSARSNAPRQRKKDVASGKAIFFVPNGASEVYDLGVSLPAEAADSLRQWPHPCRRNAYNDHSSGDRPKNEVLIGAIINGEKFVCTWDEVALGKSDPSENVRTEP